MKFYILIAFMIPLNSLFSQPTGEEHFARINFSVQNCNKKDTLIFYKNNNGYISFDSKININLFIRDNETGEINKTDNFWIIKNRMFKINYYSAINDTQKKDLIIVLNKEKIIMNIVFKLYSAKSLFIGGSEIFIFTPFLAGAFEVTDPENPKLIKVKKKEE